MKMWSESNVADVTVDRSLANLTHAATGHSFDDSRLDRTRHVGTAPPAEAVSFGTTGEDYTHSTVKNRKFGPYGDR